MPEQVLPLKGWVIEKRESVRREEYEAVLQRWNCKTTPLDERDQQVWEELRYLDVPVPQQGQCYTPVIPADVPGMSNAAMKRHVAKHAVDMLLDTIGVTVNQVPHLAADVEQVLATCSYNSSNLTGFASMRRLGDVLSKADDFARKYNVDVCIDAALLLVYKFARDIRILDTNDNNRVFTLASRHKVMAKLRTSVMNYRRDGPPFMVVEGTPHKYSAHSLPANPRTLPAVMVAPRGAYHVVGEPLGGVGQGEGGSSNGQTHGPAASDPAQFQNATLLCIVEYWPGNNHEEIWQRIRNVQTLGPHLPPVQHRYDEEYRVVFTPAEAATLWDGQLDRLMEMMSGTLSTSDTDYLVKTFDQKTVYTLSRANTVTLLGVTGLATGENASKLQQIAGWCRAYSGVTGNFSGTATRTVKFPVVYHNNPMAYLATDLAITASRNPRANDREVQIKIAAAMLEVGRPADELVAPDWEMPEGIEVFCQMFTNKKIQPAVTLDLVSRDAATATRVANIALLRQVATGQPSAIQQLIHEAIENLALQPALTEQDMKTIGGFNTDWASILLHNESSDRREELVAAIGTSTPSNQQSNIEAMASLRRELDEAIASREATREEPAGYDARLSEESAAAFYALVRLESHEPTRAALRQEIWSVFGLDEEGAREAVISTAQGNEWHPVIVRHVGSSEDANKAEERQAVRGRLVRWLVTH